MIFYEINGFCLQSSFPEIPPGNFLFSLKFQILHSDNFSMKQEMWLFFIYMYMYALSAKL